jgi:hypothetical protein
MGAIITERRLFPNRPEEESRRCYTYGMYRFVRRALTLAPTLIALAPYAVFAQGKGLPSKIVTCDGIHCKCSDLITLGQNIINTGIFFAIFFSAMLFAYAGWLYLTNEAVGGQEKAKGMFSNVAIGLVIILGAWLVVDTLMKGLLKDNIVWNNICAGLGL